MEETSVTIRNALQRDLDAIVELDALAYDASFPDRAPASRSWRRFRLVALRSELRADPLGKFVAQHEDRVIGFIFARWITNTMDEVPVVHIESVAVAPEFRGAGIGTRLLEQVEGMARRAGIPWSELEVSLTNDQAIRLYERRGYEAFRVVMRKSLDTA